MTTVAAHLHELQKIVANLAAAVGEHGITPEQADVVSDQMVTLSLIEMAAMTAGMNVEPLYPEPTFTVDAETMKAIDALQRDLHVSPTADMLRHALTLARKSPKCAACNKRQGDSVGWTCTEGGWFCPDCRTTTDLSGGAG